MFNQGTNGYSLSDIAAATGGPNNNNSWGGDGAWWIIILFLFCFAGWGGNNWGGNGTTADLSYNFDMNGLQNGLNNLAGNTAQGFYNLNTGMLTGFSNTMETVNSGTRAIQSDICNSTMNNMQNTFNLATQLNNMSAQQEQCCCDTKQLIAQNAAEFNYNLASQACQNRQVVADSTRDIIASQTEGTRAILDFLVQDKLDTLHAENQSLKGQISQSEQNAFLISQLRPQANPAYLVSNPYTGVNYTSYGCGYGSNCACSNI